MTNATQNPHSYESSADRYNDDPFDTLLTLEDTLYNSAHTLGTKDGARAGRIEGRIFGLEKGFEKFAAMGVLHGRACVWGARLASPSPSKDEEANSNSSPSSIDQIPEPQDIAHLDTTTTTTTTQTPLPSLPPNPRLEKHIQTLHALTDPLTFSTSNTEESVADFDDRFKRASAKAKIIERTIGENDAKSTSANTNTNANSNNNAGTNADEQNSVNADGSVNLRGGNVNADDDSSRSRSPKKQVRSNVKLSSRPGEGKRDDNMEDWGGARLLA